LIYSKNPFAGVPLENVKESDLILMEIYLDSFKKELAKTHSIGFKNGPERLLSFRLKTFIFVYECVFFRLFL
jgi:hypothetical protein